jgi:hypothetical protein
MGGRGRSRKVNGLPLGGAVQLGKIHTLKCIKKYMEIRGLRGRRKFSANGVASRPLRS